MLFSVTRDELGDGGGESSSPDQEMELAAWSGSPASTISKELELVLRDTGRRSEAACSSRASMSVGSASRAIESVSSAAMGLVLPAVGRRGHERE